MNNKRLKSIEEFKPAADDKRQKVGFDAMIGGMFLCLLGLALLAVQVVAQVFFETLLALESHAMIALGVGTFLLIGGKMLLVVGIKRQLGDCETSYRAYLRGLDPIVAGHCPGIPGSG